jgi:hypothetical protein
LKSTSALLPYVLSSVDATKDFFKAREDAGRTFLMLTLTL